MNPLYWITWVARRRGYPGFEAVGPVCGLLSLAFGAAAMWLTFGAVRCGAWMPVILAVAASAFFGWIAKGGPWRKSDESAFGAYVATTGGLPGVAGALV
ncbi:MAG TPA: hypothetical protein VKE69_07745, partial [Planctomycetota bacterium]|nr:hypothetical protein [Planctomycetota bacterium]